jgi:hypothetical protein
MDSEPVENNDKSMVSGPRPCPLRIILDHSTLLLTFYSPYSLLVITANSMSVTTSAPSSDVCTYEKFNETTHCWKPRSCADCLRQEVWTPLYADAMPDG